MKITLSVVLKVSITVAIALSLAIALGEGCSGPASIQIEKFDLRWGSTAEASN